MDRTELAWAAGFWDGEGSAYRTGANHRATKQPQARINQASIGGVPEVLKRFQNAVGLGRIQGPKIEEGKEPLYRWVASSRRDVEAVFVALAPWLGRLKSKQFAETLGLSRPRSASFERKELLAWCAGLFDGEGSVCLLKHGSHDGYFVLEANITQSSWTGVPEVLERFRAAFDVGWVYGPYSGAEGHAPIYKWRAYQRSQIEGVVGAMGRHLGPVKRLQAAAAIGVVSAQAPLPRGNPAWGNRKTRCVNGHDYELARIRPFRGRGVNTEPPRASHQCLVCLRECARRKRNERQMKKPRPKARLQ